MQGGFVPPRLTLANARCDYERLARRVRKGRSCLSPPSAVDAGKSAGRGGALPQAHATVVALPMRLVDKVGDGVDSDNHVYNHDHGYCMICVQARCVGGCSGGGGDGVGGFCFDTAIYFVCIQITFALIMSRAHICARFTASSTATST